MTTQNAMQSRCPRCGAEVPADAPQGLCPRCVMAAAAAPTGAGGPGPTATAEIPSLQRVAAAFPQLEIIELIGRGGMGFVFKARQPHLDRYVALKLLPDKLARDPQFAERFNREGRVLAKLNHPNIVSIYDFGKTDDFYFLLMEYVDGVNLRQAMQAGRFSPTEALSIVPKICEALQYAHEQGILHRDIKPENILLDAKGRVKIADFGIAKLVGEERPEITLTGTGATLGTPHYMAPEQLESPNQVDHRADIYSLGVVFYEMLTGELPIGRFEPPSARTPVSPVVDEVVFRTLEKDREKRYQSAQEVKTQVEHITDRGAAVPPVVGKGRHGTMMVATTSPKFSIKAIISAALVGVAWVMVGVPLVLAFAGGGLGFWELLVFGVPACLAGLTGTILGWVALSDIRSSGGQLRGVPLAVFGALACPLMLLMVVVVSLPYFHISTMRPSLAMRLVAWLLPAGVLTFALWAVYATSRWAANAPRNGRRGILKWIFVALLLVGVVVLGRHPGYLGLKTTAVGRTKPSFQPWERLPDGMIKLAAITTQPSDGFWWLPDGSPVDKVPEISVKGSPSRPQLNRDTRTVQLLFELRGLEQGDAGPRIVIPDAQGWTGQSVEIPAGYGVSHYLVSASFPFDMETTTLYAGMARGAWRVLAQDSFTASSSYSIPLDGKIWKIAFHGAVEDKDGNTVLQASYDHPQRSEFQVMISAALANGTEEAGLLMRETDGHLRVTFPRRPLADIHHFIFQVRRYHWAEFKDVRLTPLHHNTVGRQGIGQQESEKFNTGKKQSR